MYENIKINCLCFFVECIHLEKDVAIFHDQLQFYTKNGSALVTTVLCFRNVEMHCGLCSDVDKVLWHCSTPKTLHPETLAMLFFDPDSKDGVATLHALARRIQSVGLLVLLPSDSNASQNEKFFLGIIRQIFMICKKTGIEENLRCFIACNTFYVNTLTSHLRVINHKETCFPNHLQMAHFVAQYMNSHLAPLLLNSDFCGTVVTMFFSENTHLLMCALNVIQALLLAKKKQLKLVCKKLRSLDVGLGSGVSYVLHKYSSTGLRDQFVCYHLSGNSAMPGRHPATAVIGKLYQVGTR